MLIHCVISGLGGGGRGGSVGSAGSTGNGRDRERFAFKEGGEGQNQDGQVMQPRSKPGTIHK